MNKIKKIIKNKKSQARNFLIGGGEFTPSHFPLSLPPLLFPNGLRLSPQRQYGRPRRSDTILTTTAERWCQQAISSCAC